MIDLKEFQSKEHWRDARRATIGGADAAAALGLNPYKTNVQLWEEMTGRVAPIDVSDVAAVKYGTQAEPLLRQMFALDHPEYQVLYDGDAFWTNDKYPFAHASVDGRIATNAPFLPAETGVLEIKTTTIQNALMMRQWKDQVPMHYYIQLCFYLEVLEADFGVLIAQLKFHSTTFGEKTTREYYIRREDVRDDIEIIMEGLSKFWHYVSTDRKPPLKLPNL